ncbi:MAG: sigma-70 family RNA polymerase sigma factor [Myxococcales bacterium]|nr:sigma-70 family RNA polymerase sigma factor [Myxococcales bacterium]
MDKRKGRRRTERDAKEAEWASWMAAAQDGDSVLYERLLKSILPGLQGFVRVRLRDPASAEDVVQTVLLSIHRARHTYRPERPFAPWMWAIARNAVIDAQRARSVRRRREVPLDVVGEVAQAEAPAPEDASLSPHVSYALAQLPASQREAVELIHLKGLSVAEAAAQVGISPGALKVRAHRGYRALRAQLGAELK